MASAIHICSYCGGNATHQCSMCNRAKYCSVECQRDHQSQHQCTISKDINSPAQDASMFLHATDGESLLRDYVCERYIGGSTYGVVFQARRLGDRPLRVAVKIQVESPKVDASEALEESRIHKNMQTLFAPNTQGKAAPIVYIYDATATALASSPLRTWVTDNPALTDAEKRTNLGKIKRELEHYVEPESFPHLDESDIVYTQLIHITVMELVPATLSAYLSQPHAIRNPAVIAGILLHLISMLHVLEESVLFTHWDLKLDNIAMRYYPLTTNFYCRLSQSESLCIPAMLTAGYLPILANFATSSIDISGFKSAVYRRWNTFSLPVYYQRVGMKIAGDPDSDAREIFNPSFDLNKLAIGILAHNWAHVLNMSPRIRTLLVEMAVVMSMDIDNDTNDLYDSTTEKPLTTEERAVVIANLTAQKEILTIIRGNIDEYTLQMHRRLASVSYKAIWDLVFYPRLQFPSTRKILAAYRDLFDPYINVPINGKELVDLSISASHSALTLPAPLGRRA